MVHCPAWAGSQGPQPASLVEFFPADTTPGSFPAAAPGPSLHTAFLPAWRLLITAHAWAADEHVKLIGVPCSKRVRPGCVLPCMSPLK